MITTREQYLALFASATEAIEFDEEAPVVRRGIHAVQNEQGRRGKELATGLQYGLAEQLVAAER